MANKYDKNGLVKDNLEGFLEGFIEGIKEFMESLDATKKVVDEPKVDNETLPIQPDVSEEDLDKNKQDREGADYGITLVDTVVNSLIKKLPKLPYNPVPEDWDAKQEYLEAQLINYWMTKTHGLYYCPDRQESSFTVKEYETIECYIQRCKAGITFDVFKYLMKSNREMFSMNRVNLREFYSISNDLAGYEVEFLIFLMDKFHDEICYIDKELEKCSKKKSSEFVASARNVCLEFINSLEF